MMRALYNDNEPFVAAWLRSLIQAGELPPGAVDDRSIHEIEPRELGEFRQCHFFAGIGGWAYALTLAGWPESREVWTGSCPCQPFSAAGKRQGTDDARHLWPEFLRLISECRPATIFGEQVASPLGREWLDRVRADLEALGYAVGAADLCAAGVGAPHIRQRLFWVADACGARLAGSTKSPTRKECQTTERSRRPSRMADPARNERRERSRSQEREGFADNRGPWSTYEWLSFTDGKHRRAEPGTYPLATRLPGDLARILGYGNAIVPQLAAEFVSAFLEAEA